MSAQTFTKTANALGDPRWISEDSSVMIVPVKYHVRVTRAWGKGSKQSKARKGYNIFKNGTMVAERVGTLKEAKRLAGK